MAPASMCQLYGFAGASQSSSGVSIDHLAGGPGAALLRGLVGTVTMGATSRSDMVIISVSAGLEVVHRAPRLVEGRLHRGDPTGVAVGDRDAAEGAPRDHVGPFLARHQRLDRKSTRLNSSH